jgi:hypothetical protein
MMKPDLYMVRLILIGTLLASFLSGAKREESEVRDSGFGYALSTTGQSIFFTRSFNPLSTNHAFITSGVHIEEKELSIPIYDYYTGYYYQNTSERDYFVTGGVGWRRLWFQESMVGTFLPHTEVEAGIAGYVAQTGRLRTYFREFSLRWAPYLQIGAGVSIHTEQGMYRATFGYLTTVPFPEVAGYPMYEGAYLKFVISGGGR